MVKYRVLVRRVTHNNKRQRPTVHRSRTPIFLRWPWFQVHISLDWTPLDQRVGRGCQQGHLKRTEEVARKSKGSMDWRTIRSHVGISLHPSNVHPRDTKQPNVWDRGNDPDWVRRTHLPEADVWSNSERRESFGHPRFGQRAPRQKQDLEAACKLRATRRYNTKVRPRSFQKGNLV